MATLCLWGLLTLTLGGTLKFCSQQFCWESKNKEIKRSTTRTKRINMAAPHPFLGEEKRIREFYQSRGLDRVSQPSGEGMSLVVIWGRGTSKSPRAVLLPGFCSLEKRVYGTCTSLHQIYFFSEPALSNLGLPFSSFDHSKAHYYRYDEQLSLCLEWLR